MRGFPMGDRYLERVRFRHLRFDWYSNSFCSMSSWSIERHAYRRVLYRCIDRTQATHATNMRDMLIPIPAIRSSVLLNLYLSLIFRLPTRSSIVFLLLHYVYASLDASVRIGRRMSYNNIIH